jgi:hypothetical protein
MLDYKGALDDYTKAVELAPDDQSAYFNRGGTRFLMGDQQGACSDWGKAGELGETMALDMIKQHCQSLLSGKKTP